MLVELTAIEKHRLALYKRYGDELNEICPEPADLAEEQKQNVILEYIWNVRGCDQWIPILADGEEVGMLIMSTPPNCHPETDFYISQAYVLPEYRRRGLMSAALEEYMASHVGKYGLIILQGNEEAEKFWFRFFEKHGFEAFSVQKIIALKDPDEREFGFRPRRLADL